MRKKLPVLSSLSCARARALALALALVLVSCTQPIDEAACEQLRPKARQLNIAAISARPMGPSDEILRQKYLEALLLSDPEPKWTFEDFVKMPSPQQKRLLSEHAQWKARIAARLGTPEENEYVARERADAEREARARIPMVAELTTGITIKRCLQVASEKRGDRARLLECVASSGADELERCVRGALEAK